MKPSARRVLAWLGAVGGILLIVLELFGRRAAEAGEVSWFWVAVGVGMVIFGTLELLSAREPLGK